jgi:5-methylcytosine-specific restriction endonuclease McrA
MNKEITCGTIAGYRRHHRQKEKPCAECRAANSARSREYYLKNQKKIYKITRAWAARNPEKTKEYSRRITAKRKALKLLNEHEKYTEKEILDLHGFVCHICRLPIDPFIPRYRSEGLHLDHIIPLAKGGPDIIANIKPAHAACNIKKKDK